MWNRESSRRVQHPNHIVCSTSKFNIQSWKSCSTSQKILRMHVLKNFSSFGTELLIITYLLERFVNYSFSSGHNSVKCSITSRNFEHFVSLFSTILTQCILFMKSFNLFIIIGLMEMRKLTSQLSARVARITRKSPKLQKIQNYSFSKMVIIKSFKENRHELFSN